MRKLKSSRKGSSQVIATLMLVIVTLVAGIMLYQMVMGQVNSMTKTVNTQMSILSLESSSINATDITAFVHNVGQVTVEISNAYVNDEIAPLAQTVKIAASSLGVTYIKGDFVRGTSYSVKLAGMFGTLITFQVTF